MDPVSTTIVAALVTGAADGAASVGKEAVIDAYSAFRLLLTTTYAKATDLMESIVGLEKRPDSAARRDAVAEELQAASALDDEKLIAAAEAVLTAAEIRGVAPSVGMDWKDVIAARVKIGEIRARAGDVGFRAARAELKSVEIDKIDVGDRSGK